MNKYPVPSDERLEQLIRESFECMPGPDMQRLHQLEQRLARILATSRRSGAQNTLPWWAVLLLAGGFATAAWWAGEQWLDKPATKDQTAAPVLLRKSVPSETMQQEQPPEPAGTEEQRAPHVIYQREAF